MRAGAESSWAGVRAAVRLVWLSLCPGLSGSGRPTWAWGRDRGAGKPLCRPRGRAGRGLDTARGRAATAPATLPPSHIPWVGRCRPEDQRDVSVARCQSEPGGQLRTGRGQGEEPPRRWTRPLRSRALGRGPHPPGRVTTGPRPGRALTPRRRPDAHAPWVLRHRNPPGL